MSKTTCLDSMYNFYKAVNAMFGTVYLREPIVEDTDRLLSIDEARGFWGVIDEARGIRV
jgi:hypothetical protein